MMKFYCFITGDDSKELLKDTPESKKKVTVLANSVFVPVLLWFVSVLLLVHHVLEESWPVALVSASVAAFFILQIERAIIMSKGKWPVAVFRILLGLLIAGLGALSMDEVIFKDGIDKQLVVNQNQKIQRAVQTVEEKHAPVIEAQRLHIDQLHDKWTEAVEAAAREADGTGGSGRYGKGAVAELKQAQADDIRKEHDQGRIILDQLIEKCEEEKQEAREAVMAEYNDKDLLVRIGAMFDLVLTNPYMLWVYIGTTAVFFLMEFLVIILKLTLPSTNYERKMEMIEKVGMKRMARILSHDEQTYNPASKFPKYREIQEKVDMIGNGSVFGGRG